MLKDPKKIMLKDDAWCWVIPMGEFNVMEVYSNGYATWGADYVGPQNVCDAVKRGTTHSQEKGLAPK